MPIRGESVDEGPGDGLREVRPAGLEPAIDGIQGRIPIHGGDRRGRRGGCRGRRGGGVPLAARQSEGQGQPEEARPDPRPATTGAGG